MTPPVLAHCAFTVFKIENLCASEADVVIQSLICGQSEASGGSLVSKGVDELLSDAELLLGSDPGPAHARLHRGPQRHIEVQPFSLRETSHDRAEDVENNSRWHILQAITNDYTYGHDKLLSKRVALCHKSRGRPYLPIG